MSSAAEVWVVDDDETIRFVLQRALRRSGYEVQCFDRVAAIKTALEGVKSDGRLLGEAQMIRIESMA